MKDINLILGQRVKERRKYSKLTREQLAEQLNVSVRFLADVEKGIVGVSLSTLRNLCNTLNCSADHLIGLDEKPNQNEHVVAIQKIKRFSSSHINSLEKILDDIYNLTQEKQ